MKLPSNADGEGGALRHSHDRKNEPDKHAEQHTAKLSEPASAPNGAAREGQPNGAAEPVSPNDSKGEGGGLFDGVDMRATNTDAAPGGLGNTPK